MTSLRRIGLTDDQILTYQCLLENGSLTPPQLAAITKESRTSAYMSLKKMEELGLAARDANANKLIYHALSPARLEQLLTEQEEVIHAARSELQAQLPDLLSVYYSNAAKPGVRYIEGPDTLEQVYQDQVETGEDVYFVRTPADVKLSSDTLYDYMNQRAEAGITAYGLAPSKPAGGVWAKRNDKTLRRNMTWFEPAQYTAPVEIAVYGTKVVFISYDADVFASIVDSPHIAQAMREIFAMAKSGVQPAPSVTLAQGVKPAPSVKPAAPRTKPAGASSLKPATAKKPARRKAPTKPARAAGKTSAKKNKP